MSIRTYSGFATLLLLANMYCSSGRVLPSNVHFEGSSRAAKNEQTAQKQNPSNSGNNPGGQAGNPSATPNNPGGQAGNPSATGNNPGGQAGNPSATGNNPGGQAGTGNDPSGQASSSSTSGATENGVSNSSTGSATLGSTAASASANIELERGTILMIELTKSLGVQKNKPEDQVFARTTTDVRSGGQVVIPKGSKLIGHLTEAQARTTEDNSTSKLGIVFDRAVLDDGSEIAFHAVIQALTSPGHAGTDAAMGSMTSGTTSGANASTAGNTSGSAVGATIGSANAGAATGVTFNNLSYGVIGLPGLALEPAPSGSKNPQSSLITSTTKNVKLQSGSRMILVVEGGDQR
jgi:hypothetical protein